MKWPAKGAPRTLALGRVGNAAQVWVNGQPLARPPAAPGGWRAPVVFPLPDGVLKAGVNTITVRIGNLRREGGFLDSPAGMYIEGDQKLPLAGTWQYRVERQTNAAALYGRPGELAAHVAAAVAAESGERGLTVAETTPAAPADVALKLGVIPHQLKFDKNELTVKAGQFVELVFANADVMQHNFLLGTPGSLDRIGAAADAMMTGPDGLAQQYVPAIPEVLFATALVDPGQTLTVQFKAPEQPGEYPYVCTFPGHWRVMNGIMHVTPSDDRYGNAAPTLGSSMTGHAGASMSDTIDRTRLFTGCVVALVATAFGFAVRAAILGQWRAEFNLSQEQIGYLLGAGLFPFAISIILFSLIIDRLGNGVSMAIAFTLHALSAVITVAAPLLLADPGAGPDAVLEGQRNGFALLYIGTFIFALGNGTIEAVVNPVTATLYDREKTKYLNMLHAGWPGGLVLGGLVAIAVSFIDPARVPGSLWQWQVGLVLVPTLAYGLMLLGQRFPVQERVAANVPYYEMLREFGAGSCFVVCFFLVAGLNQILVILGVPTFALAAQLGIALVVTLLFAAYVRSFGRPVFILLLLIMVLLATTELGTDSWISDIMHTVLESPTLGTLFLVWTSLIMFVLRFFAGPIVHRIGPLGLLAASAAVAAVGLLWLSTAGTSPDHALRRRHVLRRWQDVLLADDARSRQ